MAAEMLIDSTYRRSGGGASCQPDYRRCATNSPTTEWTINEQNHAPTPTRLHACHGTNSTPSRALTRRTIELGLPRECARMVRGVAAGIFFGCG